MGTSRVRIGGLLFVALALFAAACGDDDTATEPDPTTTTTTAAPDDGEPDETGTDETDGTGTDDTETDPPVELADSYRGVTEDSIKLGIVLFDTDAILDLGVDVGYGDHAQHYQVVIDEMNEAGGILGRQIEPIYKFVSPVDPEEADRVCTELTEDDEVFAVLGTARPPENLLCYTETADTPFIGAPTGDLSNAIFDRSVVPFLFPGRVPSRTDGAILAAMELDDVVDGAVLAVHGADEDRIDGLAAELEARGAAKVVKSVELADEADQTALATELDRVIERFKADEVEGVINLGNNVAFMAAFNRAAYGIPIWTTSPDVLADFIYDQGATDDEVSLARLILSETSGELYDSGHEPTVACVDRWNTARPDELALSDPGEDDLSNLGQVVLACSGLDIFSRAATAAGADLTVETFTAGLDDVGSFETAGLRFASLSSSKWDASDSAKLFRWDDAEGDFVGAEALEVG
jgi:hypothetical protein